jgi:2,4-dienoyl-CoA reductase-like NADH-dependent reductase (Old Yellow Enzyme family)
VRPDLAALFEPIELGPTTLKNRVSAAAMTLLYGVDGHLGPGHIAYYEARAAGGIGFQVSEEHAAHPSMKGGFINAVSAHGTEAIPPFSELATAVHRHSSALFIQLFASGIQDTGALTLDWHPLWGVSRLPHPDLHEHPIPMGQSEIDELVGAFATSARNVAESGLDGVEVHGAHGWLISQFLSPFFNTRTDAYGGSTENQCRLAIEVGDAIRSATGGRITLGMKFSMEEGLETGITPELALAQLEIIAEAGVYDYFSISNGGAHAHGLQIPTMEMPEAYLREFGRRARGVLRGRAAIVVGHRIRRLELAAGLIEDGAADIVAMTRSHLADPAIVRKALAGQEDDIVHCSGQNECIVRALKARPVACLMNPVTGRERRWGEPPALTSSPKRVVVIGGGPAGIQASARLAERGHRVTLFEEADELGGHLGLLKRLPNREGWVGAVEDLVRPVLKAGVEVRLGTRATADAVAAEAPDAVVCATGATWDRTGLDAYRTDGTPIPGADLPLVVDIGTAARRGLADPAALGRSVVLFDLSGDYLAVGLADLLSANGVAVEMVTTQAFVGEYVRASLDGDFVFPRLARAGMRFTPQHAVAAIREGEVDVVGIWGGAVETRAGVDSVVLSLLRTPCDELAVELEQRGLSVTRIGDALAPRRTADAVYDGERAGRELFA